MLVTIELGIIVFASLEGRAPSVGFEKAITKWTPAALSRLLATLRRSLAASESQIFRLSSAYPTLLSAD